MAQRSPQPYSSSSSSQLWSSSTASSTWATLGFVLRHSGCRCPFLPQSQRFPWLPLPLPFSFPSPFPSFPYPSPLSPLPFPFPQPLPLPFPLPPFLKAMMNSLAQAGASSRDYSSAVASSSTGLGDSVLTSLMGCTYCRALALIALALWSETR